MSVRVLVVYATRYGSTAEVAHAVGEALAEEGVQVELLPLGSVRTLAGFDALVVGGPARMGRLLPEVGAFLRCHREVLGRLEVSYFLTCLTMSADSAANRRQAETYLRPLCRIKAPLRIGLFGGKIDRRRLGPLLRLFAAFDRSNTLADGDYRDWRAIRGWGRELGTLLIEKGC